MTPKPCPDCAAKPGKPHKDGCDVERCSVCHGQRMMCDCSGHDKKASAWTGEWPGAVECRERGWYAVFEPGGTSRTAWRRCSKDTPGAVEDLTRWTIYQMAGKEDA
jgi:hypothetical protein